MNLIEIITAGDEFGIDKITDIKNSIYDCGDIPEDINKSIFIELPKKLGANEYELQQTIRLMRHITKIIMRILINSAGNNMKPKIGHKQCTFIKDFIKSKIKVYKIFYHNKITILSSTIN